MPPKKNKKYGNMVYNISHCRRLNSKIPETLSLSLLLDGYCFLTAFGWEKLCHTTFFTYSIEQFIFLYKGFFLGLFKVSSREFLLIRKGEHDDVSVTIRTISNTFRENEAQTRIVQQTFFHLRLGVLV